MNLALDALAIGALRRATAARHQHLESFLRLGDPLQLGGYIDALRGFEIFLSSWEPRLRVATPARLHAWLASRSRYGFACQDLTHFNAGPRPGLSDFAACASLVDDIALNSTAAAFGSLYVLEGSALGGQVIAKSAARALGLAAHNGAAYFNGFRSQTAARWREFQQLLETEVGTSHEARSEACSAAQQTFDALIGVFALQRRGASGCDADADADAAAAAS